MLKCMTLWNGFKTGAYLRFCYNKMPPKKVNQKVEEATEPKKLEKQTKLFSKDMV